MTINPHAPEVLALLASKRSMTTTEVATLTRLSEDEVRRLIREDSLALIGPKERRSYGYRIPTEFLKRRYDSARAWAEVTN